jgi:hypothetical protein
MNNKVVQYQTQNKYWFNSARYLHIVWVSQENRSIVCIEIVLCMALKSFAIYGFMVLNNHCTCFTIVIIYASAKLYCSLSSVLKTRIQAFNPNSINSITLYPYLHDINHTLVGIGRNSKYSSLLRPCYDHQILLQLVGVFFTRPTRL